MNQPLYKDPPVAKPEIVGLSDPFGGWVSTPSGINATPHLTASVEGVEAPLYGKVSTNQYAESDGMNLFRLERFGHMAPAHVYSAVTDTAGAGGSALITDLPLNGATDSDGDTYVVLKNGRIVELNSGITTAAKYDPNVASGTHNGEVLQSTLNPDMLVMKDLAATPVEYVVWSFETNVSSDVAIYSAHDDGGTNVVDPWFSAISGFGVIKKGVPVKLCRGPDGNLYVTGGSNVYQVVINGAMASATAGLTLPLGAGWTAIGICAYQTYVAIIASSTPAILGRGSVRVFLWNGQSTTIAGVTSTAAQSIYDIADNYGSGIYFDGSVMYALTNGRNNTSKIWEFTGKIFKKVFENGLLGTSTTPLQGSLEGYQDSLMIGSTKGSQAHLFRLYSGGFHDEGLVTDGTNIATSIGMVKNLLQGQLFMGVNYSTTYTVYYQASFSKYQTNSALRTILYTVGVLGRRLYPLGFKGTITRIKIFLSQWGTGASLQIQLYKNYTTAGAGSEGKTLKTITVDTTTYPANTTNEIDINNIAFTDVSAFYAVITWNHASVTNTAAIIRRIEFHWEASQ